ncbi:MAG TPA: cytochrome P450 [Candidatus Binataceae bacterium]|nr:cytochrome P450 [Candidatus Binataceae bacterium]
MTGGQPSVPAASIPDPAGLRTAARPAARVPREPPGPGGILSGWPLMHEPLPFLERLVRDYGEVVGLRILNLRVCVVAHPDGIKHVLQDNHRNYRKSFDYKILARLLGQGLVTAEGSLWLTQRRLMQPMFHRQKIAEFGAIMAQCTQEMVDHWRGPAECGQPFDVMTEMMRLTLRIVGRALLSMDLTSQADEIGRNMTIANERFGEMGLSAFVPWLPTPGNLRFRNSAINLRKIVLDIIAERRREGRDRGDLLSMLLAVRDDETGEGMKDEQLRDEVLTLILAGHETTATALSWTWYLLSQNPEAERKLHDELDKVLDGRPPTIDDLSNLNYTGMVIEESMRLYPPVWAVGRAALADDEIMGYRIREGSNLLLSQWLAHHHPAFWENPGIFEPERFSAARTEGRPRYAFFPFGGGPRMCIGNLFALTEAQIVLATVAQKYSLRTLPDHPIEPQPLVTLRPRYGVKVMLEPRENSHTLRGTARRVPQAQVN